MAELTSTGLETRTQAEILAEIEADQVAEVSPELDLSTSSPLGQINRLFARSVRLAEEALAALYLASDPDSATGDALLRLAALTGTIREAATASRVSVTVDLDAGTYAAGALAAAPAGRPEDRFVNVLEVVAPGGNVVVVFEAEETGAIQVAANTLEIASPVAGWNSIVSHAAATPGNAIESEAALRARRAAEVESPGSSSVPGIAADLTRTIPDIESVTVIENDTDATVDSIPPFSIECVVYGPAVPTADDDDAVAEQILASKAAGPGTYGTTSRTILDSEGQSHVVRFTRPADVPIVVALTVGVDLTAYAGDAALAAHLAERAEAVYVPGLDASWDQIVEWAREVAGVLRVTAVTVDAVSFGTTAINTRQRATLDAADVTVTSAGATP